MSETRAVVAHNVIPMRAEPDSRAEQVSQAILGETVAILRDEGGYSEIRTPDGFAGWSPTRHLTIPETGERYPDPARAALVAPLFLPVFRDRSARSERVTVLTLGTAVELAQGSTNEPFFPIRLPRGDVGFVESSALIVPEYPSLQVIGPNLALIARGLIGTPYQWGGFEAVEREAMRPGDLVFFAGDHDPRGRGITHVGLALGDGRFIHAAGERGVVFSAFDEAPYDRQFQGARRLMAPPPPPS
jgi:hypothetical protein